jgi:hypothetical protein
MATDRAAKFPFWLHQALEYLVGVLIASQAIHAENLILPVIAGGVMVVLAATADGPLGAFRVVPRKLHRVADLVAAAVLAVIAVLARHDGAAVVGLVIASAVVLVILVIRTDWRARPTKAQRRAANAAARRAQDPDGGAADRIGRTAGRLAATGVRTARAMKAKKANDGR